MQHSTAVKYSERDESSITTATVGGGRSAVCVLPSLPSPDVVAVADAIRTLSHSTSFKRTSVTPSTSAAGGGKAGSNGGKSGTALGPKSSRFAAVRKGGFA